MRQKVISLQEHRNEKSEMVLDSHFNSIMPLVFDEKEPQIDKMKSMLKYKWKQLEKIRKEHNLTRTSFEKLPSSKLEKYLTIETEIFFIKNSIARITKIFFRKEK
ncbi:MAG: hypothetical protein IPL26_00315 [Leptospiraceae bacterium]|nr:hypothetical protein [Leptospiraceae bacterium]